MKVVRALVGSKKVTNFVDRFGLLGFVRVILSPISQLLTTPPRLFQSLRVSRVLFRKSSALFAHFNPAASLVALFYWTEYLNLKRYGRFGISSHIGLGNFKLSTWFHVTRFSLCLYRKNGAALVLISMIFWWSSHLIWLERISVQQICLVLLLALISTSFYVNTFRRQNYNVMGWAFYPIGLYCLVNGHWAVAALVWSIISFSSFTLIIISCFFSFVWAVWTAQWMPLISVSPAAIKLLTHLFPLLKSSNFFKSFSNISKVIGLGKSNCKYVRKSNKKFSIDRAYSYFIYLQFLVAIWFTTGRFPVLFVSGLVLLILNWSFARFADDQTMQMTMLTLGTMNALWVESPLILFSYWIMASPPPIFAGFGHFKNVLDVVPKVEPYDVKPMLDQMTTFLAPVKSGEKVLMVFENPKGDYGKIFDGYRILLELPLYVASLRKVHFMPDWWMISELNSSDSPEYWGRDVSSAIDNCRKLNAKYLVVYQTAKKEIDSCWSKSNFEVVNEFDWERYKDDFNSCQPFVGSIPKWWLLKFHNCSKTIECL